MSIPQSLQERFTGSIAESSTPNVPAVRVMNPDGTDIAGGGGGTQYTEGDTDATITGTALMMEGAGNTLIPAQGTAADGFLVNLGSNNDVITDLGFAEDTAHNSGDKGIQVLTVREDTLGVALADTVGDYAPIKTDSTGRVYVNNFASASHDTAAANIYTQSTASEAKDFDGSALPNSVDTEGDLVRNAASLNGVQYVMPVNEDGSAIADVSLSVKTTGGSTYYKNLDVDESEDEIKGTAGQIYWIHCMNLANAKRYLKFYNDTAANVIVGTTTPVLTFPLPTPGDTNGAGFNIAFPQGIAFDTAITVAATTGFADADTGAPGANEIILNLGYK